MPHQRKGSEILVTHSWSLRVSMPRASWTALVPCEEHPNPVSEQGDQELPQTLHSAAGGSGLQGNVPGCSCGGAEQLPWRGVLQMTPLFRRMESSWEQCARECQKNHRPPLIIRNVTAPLHPWLTKPYPSSPIPEHKHQLHHELVCWWRENSDHWRDNEGFYWKAWAAMSSWSWWWG